MLSLRRELLLVSKLYPIDWHDRFAKQAAVDKGFQPQP